MQCLSMSVLRNCQDNTQEACYPSQNGLMSSLPFLVMWLWGYVWGSIMDRLTVASKLSLLAIRRLSMAMGESRFSFVSLTVQEVKGQC